MNQRTKWQRKFVPGEQANRSAVYGARRTIHACLDCHWFTCEGKVRSCPVCQGEKMQYFASLPEYKRYCTLNLWAKTAIIKNLKLQPRFPLHSYCQADQSAVHVFDYVADFEYIFSQNGQRIIEDVKPKRIEAQDPVFKLKRKLFEAEYGLTLTIINR